MAATDVSTVLSTGDHHSYVTWILFPFIHFIHHHVNLVHSPLVGGLLLSQGVPAQIQAAAGEIDIDGHDDLEEIDHGTQYSRPGWEGGEGALPHFGSLDTIIAKP